MEAEKRSLTSFIAIDGVFLYKHTDLETLQNGLMIVNVGTWLSRSLLRSLYNINERLRETNYDEIWFVNRPVLGEEHRQSIGKENKIWKGEIGVDSLYGELIIFVSNIFHFGWSALFLIKSTLSTTEDYLNYSSLYEHSRGHSCEQ